MLLTPSWCGPKKATIAFLDGFGGNSWRLITTASAKEEAQKCPSITDYQYADGQGNTQKAISDIKSMAAKGTDALVVFRRRRSSGSARSDERLQGRQGRRSLSRRSRRRGRQELHQFIGASFKNDGVNWGNWIKSILPNGGNLLFLSGPAGNSQGKDELEGLKSVLGPEYKFINPAPFDVTNWDPALTQQVLTAEIAKNAKIDVIVSDFGPSLVGALPLFKKFSRSIPALATSDGNILGCFWTENNKDNPDFKLFTVATGNDNARLAVQWAVAKATGGETPKEEIFKAPNFENSVSGKPQPRAVPQGPSRRHLSLRRDER